MNDHKGVTLIELTVALAIISVLVIALGFSFSGWMGKYKVESQIKEIYADLLNARVRAMQTNRNYFFDISPDNRFYRVTQDDSDGTAKVADGDGIFQEQATWTAIQATNPANWGAVASTKDTTVTTLSRRIELTNNTPTSFLAYTSPRHAGLLVGWYSFPQYGPVYGYFRLGFDKRGLSRNMTFSVDAAGNALAFTSTTNIQNAIPSDKWLLYGWGNPTICIFTDYDGDGVSDYNPDYDCIIVSETRITLGKITSQNTAGSWCYEANCVAK